MNAAQVKYDSWVKDRLEPDLQMVQERIQYKENDIQELKLLENYLRTQHDIMEEEKLVDIGQGVFATVAIDKTANIYLNIGLGFCCECSHEEALCIIPLIKEKLQKQVDTLHEKAIDIKGRIEIAQEALKLMQNQ